MPDSIRVVIYHPPGYRVHERKKLRDAVETAFEWEDFDLKVETHPHPAPAPAKPADPPPEAPPAPAGETDGVP